MKDFLNTLIFISVLTLYMFIYDPSCLKFFENLKVASSLKLNDSFLFNVVIWMIGFWGMLLFMTSSNLYIKIISWLIFFITAVIEFGYINILKEHFNLSNMNKFYEMVEKFFTITPMQITKFIASSCTVLVANLLLKPAMPSITSTFMVVLILALTLVTIAYKGQGIVLPNFYLMPILLLYSQFHK